MVPRILLFKTSGSETTLLKYPQIELIVQESKIESDKKVKGTLTKVFKSDTYFIDELYNLYYSSINKITVNCEFKTGLISQVEDSYGKIRYLQFENNFNQPLDNLPNSNLESC